MQMVIHFHLNIRKTYQTLNSNYGSTQRSRRWQLLYFENINWAQQVNVIRRAAHCG